MVLIDDPIIQFTLKRISSNWSGTFGVLLEWDTPFAATVEPPWRDNAPFISCIPAGVYKCKRIVSPKFGPTFEIMDVPDRTHCIFHKGNYGFTNKAKGIKSSTKGCVIVGEQFGQLKSCPVLLSSKKGFNEFLGKAGDVEEFYLDIKDYTL